MAPASLLGDIIQDEILTRLPVKSLIRCRCVCKSWNSLFFDNYFARLHFNRSISRNPNEDDYFVLLDTFPCTSLCVASILSRTNSFETQIKVPYPAISSHVLDDVFLVGSINGLVCIVFRKRIDYYFILWNPANHRLSKTVSLPRAFALFSRFNLPVTYMLGFGWNSMTDEIKLIANPARNNYFCFSLPAFVYSCKMESWSNSNVDVSKLIPPFPKTNACRSPGVIVKGIPYWNFPQAGRPDIIKFNVRTNAFSKISTPVPSSRQRFSLVNIDDCLAAIEYGRLKSYVYRFNEEANCWTKLRTVYTWGMTVPTLTRKYGGEIVINDGKNRFYDFKSNQIKKIHNNRRHYVHGFSYTPSLLEPKRMFAVHP